MKQKFFILLQQEEGTNTSYINILSTNSIFGGANRNLLGHFNLKEVQKEENTVKPILKKFYFEAKFPISLQQEVGTNISIDST